MPEMLLDTSTLSDIMKGGNRAVTRRAGQYLAKHGQFSFSILTRYEILRGLEAKKATRQIIKFNQQCSKNRILPLSDEIIVVASQIYGELRRTGQIISDADILIAATARHHGLPLVTENVKHFQRVPGLVVKSWRSRDLATPVLTKENRRQLNSVYLVIWLAGANKAHLSVRRRKP